MNRRFRSEEGLTLIEVIIVLILIGIAAVFVVPTGLKSAGDGAALDGDAQKMAGALRLARQKAMTSGQTCTVTLYSDRYSISGTGDTYYDPRVTVDDTESGPLTISFDQQGYPDPSSFTINLTSKGDSPRTKTITVNSMSTVDIQ
jgi:prepilin-type N-terminal cleavage/methylation domain-containing protein